jgi:hypothetical protein
MQCQLPIPKPRPHINHIQNLKQNEDEKHTRQRERSGKQRLRRHARYLVVSKQLALEEDPSKEQKKQNKKPNQKKQASPTIQKQSTTRRLKQRTASATFRATNPPCYQYQKNFAILF